jgi:hypothetical protein
MVQKEEIGIHTTMGTRKRHGATNAPVPAKVRSFFINHIQKKTKIVNDIGGPCAKRGRFPDDEVCVNVGEDILILDIDVFTVRELEEALNT